MRSRKLDENKISASELWAVVDKDTGRIMYSRGGSSVKKRLMTYTSEAKAKASLNNYWIKQAIDAETVEVVLIYTSKS